jgi:hypothetical protein
MNNKEPQKRDFLAGDLPKTRKAQFWDILRHQMRTVISSSMLVTLFALPLFALYIVFNVFIGAAYARGDGTDVIFSLFFYGGLLAIPCLVILNIGFSGAFNVAKRLVFGEGLLLNVAFYYGLKENWKKAILMSIINALSFVLALLGSVYLLLYYVAAPILVGVGVGLLAVQYIIIGIMTPYYMSQICFYQNKVMAVIKNSFLFALMKLPLNFAIFALAPGLIIALVFANDITSYVGMGLFVFFNFIGVLLWNLNNSRVFDRFINQDHYPDYVNKGLAKKEK